MDVWDVQIPPVFYRTLSPSVPSGAAAQKEEEEKHVIERQKNKNACDWAGEVMRKSPGKRRKHKCDTNLQTKAPTQ